MLRAMVVDDFGVIRAGLRLLLDCEDDIETVGEADDVAEAVTRAGSLQPDIVLLDLVIGGRTSIDSITALRDAAPEARVVVVAPLDDPCFVRESFGAGASGYVLKASAPARLLEAVREVAAGESYLDPALGARLLVAEAGAEADPGSPLCEREREVLHYLALGHSCGEIATMLEKSPRTIELYRARIMEKLGLHSRSELVSYALANGLLGVDGDADGPHSA